MPWRAASFATVVLVSLTCASSATASPGWLASTSISTGVTNASQPSVAVAADGETIAVWSYWDGSHERVQASVRSASGGSWEAPVTLSASGQNASGPRVAIGPQGEAIVVWDTYNGAHAVVQAAVRPEAGGAWQAPVDLSDTGHEAYAPQIAIDSEGEAIAVWESYNGAHAVAQASARPEAGGAWQAPVDLSDTSHDAYTVQIALNGKGEAIAVWELNNGSAILAQASARPEAGGAWQAPVSLSEGSGLAYRPQVAVNDEGEAVVAWTRRGGGSEKVQASVRAQAGGGWTAPATLASGPSNIDPFEATVAIDAHGDAVAVWALLDQSYDETISASVRPAGAEGWGAPARLSGVGDYAEEPRVAIGPQGEAIAVWRAYDGTFTAAQAATLAAPEGSWTAPRNLIEAPSGYSYQPAIAMDPDGNAMAVWGFADGSQSQIHAAAYVASGPRLAQLSIPASGEAGRSLSFSVDPLDAWAALGQTEWSFGDGALETGTSVTHVYASAGSYEVEVRGADVLGNVTTQTRTVAIEAPPVEEPSEEPTEHAAEEVPPKHDSPAPESRVQEIATVLPATTTDSGPAQAPAPVGGSSPLMLLTKAPQPLINANSLTLKVKCGGSACSAAASGWVALPGHRRAWRLGSFSGAIAGNATGVLRVHVPADLRHAVRAYLRRHPRYRVVLHLTVSLTADGGAPQDIEAALPIWTYPGFR